MGRVTSADDTITTTTGASVLSFVPVMPAARRCTAALAVSVSHKRRPMNSVLSKGLTVTTAVVCRVLSADNTAITTIGASVLYRLVPAMPAARRHTAAPVVSVNQRRRPMDTVLLKGLINTTAVVWKATSAGQPMSTITGENAWRNLGRV